MKKIFLNLNVILLIAFCCGCNNETVRQESEAEVREKELQERITALEKKLEESTAKQEDVVVEPVIETAYGYAVIEVRKPEYSKDELPSTPTYVDPFDHTAPKVPGYTQVDIVVPNDYIYTSDIFEFKKGDDNDKAKNLDKFQADVEADLAEYTRRFQETLAFNATPSTRERFRTMKAIIRRRKVLEFSTYSEASEHKQANRGKY